MTDPWHAWQTAVLAPLLAYTRNEPRAPNLSTLLQQDPSQVDLALLAADTDRTQEYVFENNTLPEIRGASERLQTLNHHLPTLLSAAGLPADCVLYASGGGLLALVPASLADTLAAAIEASFPTATDVATITCVWRRVTPAEVIAGLGGETVSLATVHALASRPTATFADRARVARAFGQETLQAIDDETFQRTRGFGQLVQVIGCQLRQRKDQPPVRPFIEALPFDMRCQLCRVRPATRLYPYFGEQWALCDTCRTKAPHENQRNETRSTQVQRFLDWLEKDTTLASRYYSSVDTSRTIHYAQDLNEIGEACRPRRGYVGFIYADGNRMGQLLESLPTPAAYRQFSQALDKALIEAVYQALAENLHPTPIDRVSPTHRPLGRGYIHPLEPLVTGGDDLMLMLPGHVALPVAVRLCQCFERNLQAAVDDHVWRWVAPALRQPTLSVGIVIADSHNPVRVLRQVAHELCKSAKRRARDERDRGQPAASTLDYLVLTSQSMLRQRISQLREMPPYFYGEGSGESRRGRCLTAAPFTLDESCRLLQLLKEMRRVEFATSQLVGLVAALHAGRQIGSIFYNYQQARLAGRLGYSRRGDNLLTTLRQTWPYQADRDDIPWHQVPGTADRVASILPDLLELYPFVPRPGLDSGTVDNLWREILAEACDGA